MPAFTLYLYKFGRRVIDADGTYLANNRKTSYSSRQTPVFGSTSTSAVRGISAIRVLNTAFCRIGAIFATDPAFSRRCEVSWT